MSEVFSLFNIESRRPNNIDWAGVELVDFVQLSSEGVGDALLQRNSWPLIILSPAEAHVTFFRRR